MYGINRKAFAPLSKKQKICLVLAVWLAAAGILFFFNRDRNSHLSIDPTNFLQSVSVEKNHMGRCRFGLYDPADKHLLGAVSFESLKTSSANTGPFKTAALREMEIRQLQIDLPSGPAPLISSAIAKPSGKSSAPDRRKQSQVLMQDLFKPLDKQDLMQVSLPDLAHLVHIRVSDFQCRFLEGQNITLHIQSKKASMQADNTDGVILRGHVIVRTPTATLESNGMLWNIQNQTFQVQGFYSMRTGNILETGNDGCFDPQLNKLTQQRVFANKGETVK